MHNLTETEKIDYATQKILALPQVDCPVAHYFGPGIYIREVTFIAGTLAVGHRQRNEQMNVFICGKIAMVSPENNILEIAAPMTFTAGPGQKMGYVIETAIWQNIYQNPDNCRDIDVLEARHLDKSGVWDDIDGKTRQERIAAHESDRIDYSAYLEELNLTDECVRAHSEYSSDQIPFPPGISSVITVRNSDIHGRGIFASWPFSKGEIIGPARIDGKRTPFARYTNHSQSPNAKFIRADNGDIYVVSIEDIHGCRGGNQGDEITIDYRETIKLDEVKKWLE